MPEIARSLKGKIVVTMNYSDHNPPHFHVRQGRNKALVDIKDAVVLSGNLSRMDRTLDICMVKSAGGRKVDCYFTTGHVRRFDMSPLLEGSCGLVFRPLRDEKIFKSSMTVMNDTLAFDVAGNRDATKCVDIDPFVIFDEGEEIWPRKSPRRMAKA